eukprot:TRINITY_DN1898_c0_g2_i1.p1 TRINITY_DN1898_c0_g2~~TRINITY_DN1898_c0_g2_i1.p1  ORF type:complete len:113 (-),score=33.06 TRINITY_DN1898_c0_g2_i1:167-505(-)
MARSTGSLLAVALAAACCYLIVEQSSTFLVPKAQSSLSSSNAASTEGVFAQGFGSDMARDASSVVGMKAQVGGKPNRINLLYLATLLGTLVIGLIFTLGYGGYSGPGSSEIV